MRKILILTSTFLPNPGANGLITYKLVKELIKRNYVVEVISIKNNENEPAYDYLENIPIHRVSKSNYTSQQEKTKKRLLSNKWNILKRRFKNLINLRNFPNFDQEHVEEIYEEAFKVLKNEDFTDVIALSKPFSNIMALINIKKYYKNINTHAIFLDPINSISKPKVMPKIIYDKLIDDAHIKINSVINNMFQPINTQEKFRNKSYASEFIFFEYPSLEIKQNSYFAKNNYIPQKNNEITFTFAGTLDSKNRNPKIFVNTIGKLNKNSKINLYGKYDFEKIKGYTESVKMIDKGFVKQNEIMEAYYNSDFLINISNYTIESVPSKIFELFSTGKPIINYVKRPDDYSLKYFNLYPLHFNFYEWKDIDSQIKKLECFIENNITRTVDAKEIEKIYIKNTIEYFTDQVEEQLLNK